MCYVPLQIAEAVAMDETTSSSLSSTTSSSRATTPTVCIYFYNETPRIRKSPKIHSFT